MATVVISTARLDLVLQSPDEVLESIEALSPADRAEVSPAWIARVRSTPPGDPWSFSFSIVERATRSSVGICAFKGPPNDDGIVEIAYGTDEAHRGHGYATEAAAALVAFAFTSGRVRLVCAHTKPDNLASARVLTKSGFHRIGEVMDPEDGLVLRWEIVEKG